MIKIDQIQTKNQDHTTDFVFFAKGLKKLIVRLGCAGCLSPTVAHWLIVCFGLVAK